MYAIVDIAGQQFKVAKKQEIFVHRLDGKEESKIQFDNVLLIDNDGKITVGDPIVKGASVSAKIVEHLKADKVLVFKKKRRKGYQKLNGHRQQLTKICIESISEKGSVKKAEPKEKTASAESTSAKKLKTTPAPKAKPVKAAKPTAKKASTTKAKTTKKPAAKKDKK